ncbi:MAG: hypothetical protein KDA90_03730 [Planctomycetaceae bacterium]|nr:hypothetical protein [Planctomycetaceae bacterium]
MQELEHAVASVDELRQYVHFTLCEREMLLAEQFETQDQPLVTRGNFCGLQFSLRGPRAIKLGAIWAADQNVIFFYDTRGERYLKVNLQQRFTLPTVLAEAG